MLTETVRNEKFVRPPEKSNIPWELPRAIEVMKYFEADSDNALYDDLVEYFKSVSEMPADGYYDLLAVKAMETYCMEKVKYSGYIWLYAIYQRGKSRTGKALTYISYRGIIVESLRDSYMIRVADEFQSTLFIDVEELWKKAEKTGTTDILMNRFEKGCKVPRVMHPDYPRYEQIVYYDVFGATIIATNETVGDGMATRSFLITMPETSKTFDNDISPQGSLPLKERLVAFRARHLKEELPNIPKPAKMRLGDIARPLLQILTIVKPDKVEKLEKLIVGMERERQRQSGNTIEGIVVAALLYLSAIGNGIRDGKFTVDSVTKIINESQPQYKCFSNRTISDKLLALGFKPTSNEHGTNRKRYEFDSKLLELLRQRYGLEKDNGFRPIDDDEDMLPF